MSRRRKITPAEEEELPLPLAEIEEEEDSETEDDDFEEIEIEPDELELDDDDSEPEIPQNQRFQSRNRDIWWTSRNQSPNRRQASNILDANLYRYNSLTERSRHIETPIEAFRLFLDPEILFQVMNETNRKAKDVLSKTGEEQEWKELDQIELDAFLGLLIFAGVTRSGREPVNALWKFQAGMSRSFFYSVMSRNRFKTLLRFIRFDDFNTREERLSRNRTGNPTNKLAPIDQILNRFTENCQSSFIPSPIVCIDEQLQGFRGRCAFKVFIKTKPAKYGLMYDELCCVETNYCWNLILYAGGKFL